MSKLYIALVLFCSLTFTVPALADNFPPSSVSSSQSNVTVTGTALIVLAYDASRGGWNIHPENGAIRCTWGNAYGSVPPNPTTNTGYEFANAGYYSNFPITNPTGEVICIAESSSVSVSLNVDSK